MTHALALLLLLAPQSAPLAEVGAGPEPSSAAISWELDFKFLDPQRIEMTPPGSSKPEVYWYMIYKVVNRSDRTQRFFPTFQLVTHDLKVLNTDVGVKKEVFEAIRERNKRLYRDLMHPTAAIGELRTGEDNARESVAIWRADDVDVNAFTIFVAGLSGETRVVTNPTRVRPAASASSKAPSEEKTPSGALAETDAGDPAKADSSADAKADGSDQASGAAKARDAKAPAASAGGGSATGTKGDAKPADARDAAASGPKQFTLRKTLEVRYTLPGSAEGRASAEIERRSVRWIMR